MGLAAQGQGFLGIDDGSMGGSALGGEPWRDIATRLAAAQMQEGAGIVGSEDEGEQRLGIALRGDGAKSGRLCDLCGTVADAPCRYGQSSTCLAQAGGGFDPCFRGEDKGAVCRLGPGRR